MRFYSPILTVDETAESMNTFHARRHLDDTGCQLRFICARSVVLDRIQTIFRHMPSSNYTRVLLIN